MSELRWKLQALGCTASLIAIAAPAYGQDVSSDPDGANEIIVTAQKRSERINDVPLSITAASGDQLTKQGVADTAQLTKLVPGFTFQKGAYGAPIYAIRGIGFSDRALGSAPAVSVYVDQVPLPYSTVARGAALDLERVEVLKGPQGTLFGQNSTGGAINYIAAKPTKELHAGFDISYGRFNSIEASAFVSGPISNTLTARLALRREYADGWQYSLSRPNDSMGKKDFSQGRLLVDWNPVETLRFEFAASAWQDRGEMQAQQFAGFAPGVSPSNPTIQYVYDALSSVPIAPNNNRAADWDDNYDFRRHDDFYLFSLRGDLDLTDDITLTSITAYSKLKANQPLDSDGSPFTDSQVRSQRANLSSFSQELRLAGNSGPLRWMIGGNYQRQVADQTNEYRQNSTQNAVPPLFIFTEGRLIVNQKPITKSAFGSVDFNITPQLTVQGSIRYTDQKRSFNGCLADNGVGPRGAGYGDAFNIIFSSDPRHALIQPGGCVTFNPANGQSELVNSDLDEDNLSWRGGINWKPSPDTLLYANVTKGYKSGSFSIVPAVFNFQFTPVTQESVLAYEAGFKVSVADRKVDLSGAMFYYDYKNKQLLGNAIFPIFGRLPTLINIPKSRIQGAELAITARPFDGLRMTGGVTYVDSKVQKDPQAPFGAYDILGRPTSFVGDPFPSTPKWQVVADAEYSIPLNGAVGAFVGGTFTYQTSTYSVFGGGDTYPLFGGGTATTALQGYALGDLRGGIEKSDGDWRLQLWVRNVANKNYSVGADRVIDNFARTAGTPRTYGASFTYRY